MRRVLGPITCAVLLLLATTSSVAAQGGTVRGRVADTTGAPLARATITIEALGARATTNDQGDYELRAVPAGTYTVRARLLGYVPQTTRVAVGEGQVARQ
ncbi:MAG TPA: carboxypeptidase regulatory-like domain-containing protein, partial [Gemmatimonadales bacterium]|nr:carboxypeptidase regulatory-like domain-containing protein [Gemmatimonadales bacterium]